MKIKKPIELNGSFWLPQEPNDRISGIVGISEFGDAELFITSSPDDSSNLTTNSGFAGIESNGGVKTYHRIIGEVEFNGRSEPITLEDCFCTSWYPSVEGDSIAIFTINFVYLGAEFEADDEITFSKVTLTLEGMKEWSKFSEFDVEQKRISSNKSSTVTPQNSQFYKVYVLLSEHDCELELFNASTNSNGISRADRNSSQNTKISIKSNHSRSLEEFIYLIVCVQQFFSLIIDDIVCLEALEGYSNKIVKDKSDSQSQMSAIQIFYKSIPRTNSKFKTSWNRMLLPYCKITDQFPTMLSKWMDACRNYGPAIDYYFAVMFGASKHLEVNFLFFIQGLEAFHRRKSNETEFEEQEFEQLIRTVIDFAPTDKRKFLEGKLRFANELSLRKRLKKLFEPFSNFYESKKDWKSLIDKSLNTRNYLTHSTKDLESRAMKGRKLFELNRRLEVLFQLHLLQILGLELEELNEIVENNYSLKSKFKELIY